MGQEFSCMYCGQKEIGHVYCPSGHFVCDHCHGKDVFEIIQKSLLLSKDTNPLSIAEKMFKNIPLPMLGCEHAWIATGALLVAIKNHGVMKVTDDQITEALNRTRKQAIGAYCGLTGVCGVVPAIGAAFSVILGAACPKEKETSTTMYIVARVVKAIADQTGPCCCKNFVRTSLALGCELVEEYLGIQLPCTGKITCQDSQRHPHGCRENKCNYYCET